MLAYLGDQENLGGGIKQLVKKNLHRVLGYENINVLSLLKKFQK